ncbi:lactate dehydrogenase [Bacillus sp. FJAT-27231]|uniref:Ldh family oxidoreductase n=1 Tax=Bacillus sp. FJAT-27231 TaxID=1679168 RepID=UPI000670EA14|nr:Ldh family oxidoreductase [Bacillus sp. FJAT-27231]KMY54513.1 lactate dehydrogenase [Bacillus sp. FJAT-27231]
MYSYAESDLKLFCESVLKSVGITEADASIVAESLVQANLEGVDSHGISRLPIYMKRLMDKRINAAPAIQLERGGSVLTVDGDNGLGHVVSYHALTKGMEIAKQSGIAAIAIKNSNHFGAASYFCQLACEQNMICIGFTNSPSGIAPWGGKEAFFGTNPIALGFPTGNDTPVIIDLSTSVVARGKIMNAVQQKDSIPDGWAIDRFGKPTNDPQAALEGAVLPMGGPKGSALALAVELLAGVLSGAAFGPHVNNIYNEKEADKANVGHFFILMDIKKFTDLETFFQSVQNLLKELKLVAKVPGINEIRYPGERRKKEEQMRKKTGIQLTASLEKELAEIGEQLHVKFPERLITQSVEF